MAKIRSVDRMYEEFGVVKEGYAICKACAHFKDDRCHIYGASAKDFRSYYPACGQFNKEYDGNPVEKIRRKPNTEIKVVSIPRR